MNKVFDELAEMEEGNELLDYGGKFSFIDCFRYHHQVSLDPFLLMRSQYGRESQYKIQALGQRNDLILDLKSRAVKEKKI